MDSEVKGVLARREGGGNADEAEAEKEVEDR